MKSKFIFRAVLAPAIFVLTIFAGQVQPFAAGEPAANSRREGVVHWVIDGDTFQLETGERIRMIGMDTPEFMPWKGRVDYYGREAAAYSKSLLTGKKVFLEQDVEPKDRYGRTLAYVYLENGEFVNLLLVREGYARAKFYRPNGRYYKELKEAEREAKKLKKRLWAVPAQSTRGLNLSHHL